MMLTAIGNMLLFQYASSYQTHGAESTFSKIVIHVLISAIAVLIVWLIIKRVSQKNKIHKK